jgi:hypothetical protein
MMLIDIDTYMYTYIYNMQALGSMIDRDRELARALARARAIDKTPSSLLVI